jgi:hypothetical protein
MVYWIIITDSIRKIGNRPWGEHHFRRESFSGVGSHIITLSCPYYAKQAAFNRGAPCLSPDFFTLMDFFCWIKARISWKNNIFSSRQD